MMLPCRLLALLEAGQPGLELAADGHAVDAQVADAPEVVEHQDAHRILVAALGHTPRGRADATLEVEGNHARAGAHGALLDGPAVGVVQRLVDVLDPHVGAGDVVQKRVVTLADQRDEHVVLVSDVRVALQQVLDGSLGDHAHRQGVGQQDGRLNKPPLEHLQQSAEFAGAVEHKRAADHALHEQIARSRNDGGDARAHHTGGEVVGPTADQRLVADADAGDVGDGVERPRRKIPDGDAEISQSAACRTAWFHGA